MRVSIVVNKWKIARIQLGCDGVIPSSVLLKERPIWKVYLNSMIKRRATFTDLCV